MGEGLWLVWDGKELSLPYPGSLPTGSQEAAEHFAKPNAHLGWQAVHVTVDFVEEGHQCVMEYTHSEPTWGAHYECKICGAKTP
jgi:hypothetical protein